MTGTDLHGDSSAAAHDVADHERVRMSAYEVLAASRGGHDGAHADAAAHAELGRRHGWHDVRAIAEYAILRARVPAPASDGSVPDRDVVVDTQHEQTIAMVEWTQQCDDTFARALALTARAHAVGRLTGHPDVGLDDLVHAYALIEQIAAPVDRAFVLHELATQLSRMSLWELTGELYDDVERLTVGITEPETIVAGLACNRYVLLADELLHATAADDASSVAWRTDRVAELAAGVRHPAIPEKWRASVTALSEICMTLTTHDAETLTSILDTVPIDAYHDPGIYAVAQCVVGWHHLEHGRYDDARPLIEAGTRTVLDHVEPIFDDTARWLRARLHERELPDVVRRHVAELVRTGEMHRGALARSVRARLQSGRVRVERDRYARESLTDALTGLANRRALDDRLTDAARPMTLLLADIDAFKAINDCHGHDVGDDVLRRIGAILSDCIRPGDVAARLGGDEFVVIIEAADADVATSRAGEIRDRVHDEPWNEVAARLFVEVSVGVAWGTSTGRDLYRRADRSLYAAKRAGGGQVRSADPVDAA